MSKQKFDNSRVEVVIYQVAKSCQPKTLSSNENTQPNLDPQKRTCSPKGHK
jgi:hypothetical protein